MPKGCLNKIILAVITIFTGVTIAVAGIYIGYVILMDGLKAQIDSTNEELKARAEQLADFSSLPPGYSVTKALDLAGVKIVLAKYPYNSQMLGIVDPGWILNINKKDLTIEELESKIEGLLVKINQQDKLKINNFMADRYDHFRAMGQKIPYMKVTFSVSGNYNDDYRGLVGIVENPVTGRNNLIFSYNKPNDYRQVTAERFFQNIELVGEN